MQDGLKYAVTLEVNTSVPEDLKHIEFVWTSVEYGRPWVSKYSGHQCFVRVDLRSNRRPRRVLPQFRNKLHQEVVYSSLPHHHRRKSHKMAAEAIKRQVQGVTGMPEVRLLLRDICQHLLLASRTTSTSDGSKYRLLDEEEVKDVEASLSRAAANSQDLGYYEESMIYRVCIADTVAPMPHRPTLAGSTDSCADERRADTAAQPPQGE